MKIVDYREMLRLEALGYSRARIAASVRSSHHTVKVVLDTAASKGVVWPLGEGIGNEELGQLLFPDKSHSIGGYAEPDYATIHKELAKPGVTMTLLWEEYRTRCYENSQTPYQSTQFGEKYHRWARVTKATMRIQHKPRDAMEVD